MPAQPLLIAKGTEELYLLPKTTNRHGLVAGATGTGKTVTLQVIAENLSKRGSPLSSGSDCRGAFGVRRMRRQFRSGPVTTAGHRTGSLSEKPQSRRTRAQNLS